ncbi:MAG: DUF1203 domain-containing protein [Rhizomicrobium sp.]|jgi:hypothetical protein
MDLRYRGLAAAQFSHLFGLTDTELERRAIRRMVAATKPGFPCRVTLEDAEPGERVLLLPYDHQPALSPYRASGPIFVREAMFDTFDQAGPPPPVFSARQLSLRAFAGDGMMVDADLVEGAQAEPSLNRLFDRDETAYVHVHFAKRGCYACRVERG